MRLATAALLFFVLSPLAVAAQVPRVGGYLQARETYQSNVGVTASINRAASAMWR